MSKDFLPFTRPSIDEETIAGVAEVLRSGWITSGPQVREFEARLSAYFGGRPVRALSSATGGLEIGLALAGVGPGDEVITTPLSWVATANVIVRAGARPVFVDVERSTRNIDLTRSRRRSRRLTRALLPVDLAGLPVDRGRLYAIAERHGLRVIEDAAQSMGASWHGQRIGASGDLVSISFHANKNITTAEGGCLVLNDAEEARRCELWRLQGVERFADGELDATLPGGKHNMTDIAARIGLGQLARLEEFTARRHALARRYFQLFRPLARLPAAARGFHAQQLAHVPDRAARAQCSAARFIARCTRAGIGVGVHYPAIHLLTLYRRDGLQARGFPASPSASARGIATLPLFPAMRDADVDRVCGQSARILKALSTARAPQPCRRRPCRHRRRFRRSGSRAVPVSGR